MTEPSTASTMHAETAQSTRQSTFSVTPVADPTLDHIVSLLVAPSNALADEARRFHNTLTKPAGALGRVETLGVQLSSMYGAMPPPPMRPAIAVFAGDHGVVHDGVTPWPQDVTAQMAANMASGGAAINAIAKGSGATVTVVDVGVATELPNGLSYVRRRVRNGTANIRKEPAMTVEEAEYAVDVGASIAADLIRDGANVLVGGEMGIGNTTSAAALIAAFCDLEAAEVAGRGTGIDDAMLAHKVAVIADALMRCGQPDDPIELLAELGGLEIAALAGFYVSSAAHRIPVVLDGVISLAAALVANEIDPIVRRYFIAGHRSTEPAASKALDHLKLSPLLELDLRLGEGSGAALALPLIDAAGRIMRDMATFDGAAIVDSAAQ